MRLVANEFNEGTYTCRIHRRGNIVSANSWAIRLKPERSSNNSWWREMGFIDHSLYLRGLRALRAARLTSASVKISSNECFKDNCGSVNLTKTYPGHISPQTKSVKKLHQKICSYCCNMSKTFTVEPLWFFCSFTNSIRIIPSSFYCIVQKDETLYETLFIQISINSVKQ